MAPAGFTLVDKRQETPDTWTLELEARDGEALAFSPGQFTMISAASAGEVPISISGDPGSPRLVHTIRAVGLATEALCRARPGEVLDVRGPFGGSWPVAELAGDGDVVVVTGGTGLAPLRSAIIAMLEQRDRYGRLVLLYGGRSPDQLLYLAELGTWRDRGLEVLLTVDSAGPEWIGHVGVVPRLIGRVELDWQRASVLLCGPEVMMRFAASALRAQGARGERIYASLERNMQCGIGQCGHCQLGPMLLCRDGPIYPWSQLEPWLRIKEL
jgi:NAD(P)H-flavin reductase